MEAIYIVFIMEGILLWFEQVNEIIIYMMLSVHDDIKLKICMQ